MSHNLSRRRALATGAASTGLLTGSMFAGESHARTPGADPTVKRDITPGPTPIRLATRMVRGKGEHPDDTVRRIRDGGYTAVNTQPSQWNDFELVEMCRALKKYDVAVFEVGCYSNIIHPDRAKRQENLANVVRKFEDAEKIGGPMVATVTGSCSTESLIYPHPDNWSGETWKLTVASVKQILNDTAGMKVSLGMEAQVTTNLDGPKAHKRLMEDVGDPRCAVNLDPTNMVTLETYHHTTELLDECFDLLGESILGCHAKDTWVVPDVQTVYVKEVCPGKGIMDYETFLARMSRLKWPRALFPEHIEPEEFPQADAYIKKVAAKIGVKMYS